MFRVSTESSRKRSWQILGAALGVILGLAANRQVRNLMVSTIRLPVARSPLTYSLLPRDDISPEERQNLKSVLGRLTTDAGVSPEMSIAAWPAASLLSEGTNTDDMELMFEKSSGVWTSLNDRIHEHLTQIRPLQKAFRTHRKEPVIAAAYVQSLVMASNAIQSEHQEILINGSFRAPYKPGSPEWAASARNAALVRVLQTRLLEAAGTGERLEPWNALWPLTLATAHLRLNDDKSMFADLDRAFHCQRYDEHTLEHGRGQCELYRLVNPVYTTPTELLKVVDANSRTVTVDLYRLWNACAWKALLLEHDGHDTAGMAIRKRLAKLAAMITSSQTSRDRLYVSESLVLRSMHGIKGSTEHIFTEDTRELADERAYVAANSALNRMGEKQTEAWFARFGLQVLRHRAWLSHASTSSGHVIEALNTSACYALLLLFVATGFVIIVLGSSAAILRYKNRYLAPEPVPCGPKAFEGAVAAIWCTIIGMNAFTVEIHSISLVACIVLAAVIGAALLFVKRDIRKPAGLVRGFFETAGWWTYAVILAIIGTWQIGTLIGPGSERDSVLSQIGAADINKIQAHLQAAAALLPMALLFLYASAAMCKIKYLRFNVAIYRLAMRSAVPALAALMIAYALLSWKTASDDAGFRATMIKAIGINVPAE
jgi:hypothetical protein